MVVNDMTTLVRQRRRPLVIVLIMSAAVLLCMVTSIEPDHRDDALTPSEATLTTESTAVLTLSPQQLSGQQSSTKIVDAHVPAASSRCDVTHSSPRVIQHTIASSAIAMRSIPTCSDKFTSHRYQEMYGRMLLPYREDAQPLTTGTPTKKIRLLEIGLGCQFHFCAAGGAQLYRNFMPVATTTYHSLEFNIGACKEKYDRSGVDAQLAQYIDDHLCSGSSADLSVVDNCGEKFGPFDVVIDDGSHMHAHTTFAFRYWLNSSHLKPGGVLVIEDLQVSTWVDFHETASDAADAHHAPGLRHPVNRGTTTMSYAQRLFMCKLARVLCGAPPAGPMHAVLPFVSMVSEVVLGPEITGFRKVLAELRESPLGSANVCAMSSDVGLVLSPTWSLSHVTTVFSNKALIFVANVHILSLNDNEAPPVCPPISKKLEDHFQVKFGVAGYDTFSICVSAACGAQCVADAFLQHTVTVNKQPDAVWIAFHSAYISFESAAITESSVQALTFLETSIVTFLGHRAISDLLGIGGVVVVDGVRALDDLDGGLRSGDVWRAPQELKQPLLRFLADLSMHLILVSPEPRYKRGKKKKLPVLEFPWEPLDVEAVKGALWHYGDISTSAEGMVVLRIVDAHNRRAIPNPFTVQTHP